MRDDVDLGVEIGGLRFPSLILNASGCFNPSLFHRVTPLETCLGGIVTKTVTRQPTPGNPQQRTVELPGVGMLNSIGLQNPGLDDFLDREILELAQYHLPVVLSISARSVDEFGEMARFVMEHPHGDGVKAIEVNLSCPNIAKGGVDFGNAPQTVRDCTRIVAQTFDRPVFAKLTPNVTSILPVAEAAIEGGAHALTAINTVLGSAIDIRAKRPHLRRVSGGYSGPGIKPIAIHAIWQIHRHFPDTPIIGVGGIADAADVLEFLMAGASLVQVGTSCFRDPAVFRKIREDLRQYCQTEELARLGALTGCAHGEKMLTS